jgi:hypothetical protein
MNRFWVNILRPIENLQFDLGHAYHYIPPVTSRKGHDYGDKR